MKNKLTALHEGKAKIVYPLEDQSDKVIMVFKDSLTAFNAEKKSSFPGKGQCNRNISSLVFRYLKKEKILNHWVKDQSDNEMICHKLKIIPLEVVVRNRLAGSTAQKFNIPEGTNLKNPLVEFYYKNDLLKDPFMSEEQVLLLFDFASKEELQYLKTQALTVNQKLQSFFDAVDLELIDFKLEFGKDNKEKLMLGDEFSPDSCRLWEKSSGEKRDKDRFRQDLGSVQESYKKVQDILIKRWSREL